MSPDNAIEASPSLAKRSLRAGFWLGVVLATSSLLFSGGAAGQMQSSQAQPDCRRPTKPVPETTSIVLLSTSLLTLGSAVLAGRLRKQSEPR